MGFLDNIPQAMRDRKQWMLAGPDKAPRAVDFLNETTYAGAKNNRDQHMTYSEARYWAEQLGMYMGYIPLPDDPFTIIDLDWKESRVYDVDANDIKTGLYTEACKSTYVETSMSGKGAHIIVEGKLANDFNVQTAGIECYGNKGFVVITGRMQSASNVVSNQQGWLDWLVAKYPRAVDDATFGDLHLNQEQILHASPEELALDEKFADWVNGWHNRERIDEWMTDRAGDDRSAVDIKVMQLFVKFTRDRAYPDESAVRMFMRCPRAKLLGRKQDVSQYLKRTLVSAKARVALDDKRAKDYDFSEGSRKLLEQYQAQIEAAKPQPAQADPTPDGSAPINMGAMSQRAPMASEAPFTGFNWLTKSDLEKLPKLEWVVKGMFPAGGLGAIYGESGAGKSFVAIDMIAAIAEGQRWFNCRTKQLPVSVFALEGEGGLKGRVRAWESVNKREYPHSVFFWDSARNGSFALRDGDGRSTTNKDRLIQLCADLKANGRAGGVVVIDTLNQASDGADENSSRDMGELVRAMKFIQRETGSLVLIVHHSTKSKENQSMRGHSSLYGAMDGIMEVLREVWSTPVGDEQPHVIEGRRGWVAKKVKDGRDGHEHYFEMKEVQVDMDEDGPVMSVAIEPVAEFIVDPESGEINEIINVGSIKPPKATPARGRGKRTAAGDRQAPVGAVQQAPTWKPAEYANGVAPPVTRPGRPRWQSPQQQNIIGAIRSLCAQSGDASMSAGGQKAITYLRAVEAVEKLLPKGAENKARNNIKAAFDKMVSEGAFGRIEHGTEEWIWPNV